MKRLAFVLAISVLMLCGCQYIISYHTDELLPDLIDPVTEQEMILSVTVTDERNGDYVVLEGRDVEMMLMYLEGVECARRKVKDNTEILYRISFTLQDGTAPDFCIVAEDEYLVGNYRYISINGFVDLIYFENLFK